VVEAQGGWCSGNVPLSEQPVTLFLSVIDGGLGIMNGKNLCKIQHPFAGRKVGPSTDGLAYEASS